MGSKQDRPIDKSGSTIEKAALPPGASIAALGGPAHAVIVQHNAPELRRGRSGDGQTAVKRNPGRSSAKNWWKVLEANPASDPE